MNKQTSFPIMTLSNHQETLKETTLKERPNKEANTQTGKHRRDKM
jgi:hypothetical protein